MIMSDFSTIIIVHGDSKFDYTPQCIKSWSKYPNVIWSTWEDTPQNIIDLLKHNNMHYVISPYPPDIGMSHQNLQKMGFLYGLEYAKQFNPKYIYKTRNDLDITNLEILLDALAYCIDHSNGKLINALCFDNLCNGICDYCMFGNINEIEFYWNIPEKYLYLPSERYFLAQYFERKGINYMFTYESALQLIDTHISLLDFYNVNINRFKYINESPLQEHFANRAIYL